MSSKPPKRRGPRPDRGAKAKTRIQRERIARLRDEDPEGWEHLPLAIRLAVARYLGVRIGPGEGEDPR